MRVLPSKIRTVRKTFFILAARDVREIGPLPCRAPQHRALIHVIAGLRRRANIAAHAHSIEFGLLAIMLAFFQPYVSLRECWKRRWAGVLLLGSLLLPVCVLLEMKYGLVAGGVADFAGLLIIFALLAMGIGILRYTGELDAATRSISARGVSR